MLNTWISAAAVLLYLASPSFADPPKAQKPKERLYSGMAGEIKTLKEWASRLASEDATERASGAIAMQYAGEEALPFLPNLVKALTEEKVQFARRQIALSFASLGPKAASSSPVIVAAIKIEEDPATLGNLFRAIAVFHPKEAGPAVAAIVGRLSGLEPQVRLAAWTALAEMGESSAPAVPVIAAFLEGREPDRAAVVALGRIGKPAASSLPALRKLRDQSKDYEFAIDAANSMATISADPKEALPTFERIYASPFPKFRMLALAGIEASNPKTEVYAPLLVRALKDEAADVGYAAAIVLAEFPASAAPAVDLLVAHLLDEDLQSADSAARALAKIGPAAKAALPTLEKLLARDDDPFGQILAARGIRGIAAKADTLVSVLVHHLSNHEPVIRALAAELLGEFGGAAKPALIALGKAAEDDESTVRRSARQAIERISAP